MRFDIPTVEAIKEKHHNDIKKCCQEMFKLWLTTENVTKPKIWLNLLKGLKKVEELTSIVEIIEVNLKQS